MNTTTTLHLQSSIMAVMMIFAGLGAGGRDTYLAR